MGVRQDAFDKVWKDEDKANYGVGQVSDIKKNKQTGQYEVDFQDGFVRFVGNAHTLMNDTDIPQNGLTIKISSCDVTSNYSKEKNKTYVNYVIFGFEIPDGNNSKKTETKKSAKKEADNEADSFEQADDDLPF